MRTNYRHIILILLMSLTCISQSVAQDQSEKASHQSFELGLGVSPIWFNTLIRTNVKSGFGFTEKSVFPPALYVGYSMGISPAWDFTGQIGFKGLQNSNIVYRDQWQPYSNIRYSYLDTFALRMNAITLDGSFKKFRYGSHGNGLYLSIGPGMTFVKTNVYTSLTTRYEESTNPDNTFEEVTTTRLDPWSEITMVGFVSGGLGAQLSYRELGYVDFGFRVNYHVNLNKNAFKELNYSSDPEQTDKEMFDYQNEFRPVINRMARTNAFRSYYLEFYVKIGLSK